MPAYSATNFDTYMLVRGTTPWFLATGNTRACSRFSGWLQALWAYSNAWDVAADTRHVSCCAAKRNTDVSYDRIRCWFRRVPKLAIIANPGTRSPALIAQLVRRFTQEGNADARTRQISVLCYDTGSLFFNFLHSILSAALTLLLTAISDSRTDCVCIVSSTDESHSECIWILFSWPIFHSRSSSISDCLSRTRHSAYIQQF